MQDVGGRAFGADNPRSLPRLVEALEAAARGEPLPTEARRKPDLGRSAAFSITPTVMLDNDASETSTVVEASGRDRPGLLAALARTLADADLSILSAHIDGYGERAVDAFYVTDVHGAKITDARKGNALKTALLADFASLRPKAAMVDARPCSAPGPASPVSAVGLDKRLEAAEDHALAVEGHVLHARLHPRVGHHLAHDLVAGLRGILDDPGEDDHLVLLGLDGAGE